MTMQEALIGLLLGATPAGQRVFWVNRPQSSLLPAITLQTISGDRPRTHQGLQSLRQGRVQLDAWGATYTEARGLVEAAVAVLAPIRVTADGIFFDHIDFEGEADTIESLESKLIYRTRLDLLVWHSPA